MLQPAPLYRRGRLQQNMSADILLESGGGSLLPGWRGLNFIRKSDGYL